MPNDLVSKELRATEREIDAHHLANPLFQQPFNVAAQWFLTICEDLEVIGWLRGDATNTTQRSASAANLVLHAKWPLRWLTQACPQSSSVSWISNDALYTATWQLSQHSIDYLAFESAFTYASLGLLTLRIDGKRIKASGPMIDDSRLDAYDLLTSASNVPYEGQAQSLVERVAASVRVNGAWFDYDLNPQIVQAGLESLNPIIDHRFVLPQHWQLPNYTIGQFGQIARILYVLGSLHSIARRTAATSGCLELGIARALIVMDHSELIRRLCRYSGLRQDVVAAIVADLTYGARGQSNPDPALQPIVPLTSSTLAMSPSVLMHSSMERNISVLQNRLPDGREVYTALSQDREMLSRETIIKALTPMGFRFWHGHVPHWGGAAQVDLAIISDSEQQCLILELKSFIAPADPREILDRSSEIQKGIKQVQERVKMTKSCPNPLRTVLQIDDSYCLTWAVASETSIGASHVQSDDVPVIKTSHLVAKLRQSPMLTACCRWLENRDYLPVEGVHYQEGVTEAKAGGWTLEWPNIKALVDDYV